MRNSQVVEDHSEQLSLGTSMDQKMGEIRAGEQKEMQSVWRAASCMSDRLGFHGSNLGKIDQLEAAS